MSPSNFSSPRSRPVTIGRLRVAGLNSAASSAGNWMCAVITASAPAAMPSRNGASSTPIEPLARLFDDRQPEVRVDVGVAVTGKMLERREHAARAAGRARTRRQDGRRPRATRRTMRVLITGLRGLLLTSTTGAKLTCTPSARASVAVMRPACYASDARRLPAAIAIGRGNAVAPAMRNPTPDSKSAVLSSGTGDSACSRLSIEAAASGWPSVTVP